MFNIGCPWIQIWTVYIDLPHELVDKCIQKYVICQKKNRTGPSKCKRYGTIKIVLKEKVFVSRFTRRTFSYFLIWILFSCSLFSALIIVTICYIEPFRIYLEIYLKIFLLIYVRFLFTGFGRR